MVGKCEECEHWKALCDAIEQNQTIERVNQNDHIARLMDDIDQLELKNARMQKALDSMSQKVYRKSMSDHILAEAEEKRAKAKGKR